MASPTYIAADGTLTDPEAWVALATTTLGSSVSAVTFTSPNDGSSLDWGQFMDLMVIWYARSDRSSTNNDFIVRFNNDSGSDYEVQSFSSSGSSANPYATTTTFMYAGNLPAASSTANHMSAGVASFMDVNSGKYKSLLAQSAKDANGSGYADLLSGVYRSQSPVTRIDLMASGNNLVSGSKFSLFGILPRMVS